MVVLASAFAAETRADGPRSPGMDGFGPAQAEPLLIPPASSLLLKPEPIVIPIFAIPPNYDSAAVTGIAAADFNGNGLTDLAVAWYATDLQDMSVNRRAITILYGTGRESFLPGPEIDLYISNDKFPELSIFRNGTSEIVVGDFDGDGDPDIAALPFFGDELWFIENMGDGTFDQHLYFIFDINSEGNAITPPKAFAADFVGNGRDELVYVVDPVLYVDQVPVHFWRGARLDDMRRARWEGFGGPYVSWSRSLAVGDYTGDGKADLAFSASDSPPLEIDPIIVVWHSLNLHTRKFQVSTFQPGFLCSEILPFRSPDMCRSGIVALDLNGTDLEFWRPTACSGPPAFELAATESGFTGSVNRGMAGELGDLNGDGMPDLVTRQKLASLSTCDEVEVAIQSGSGAAWSRVDPTPLSTCGFAESGSNQILRPRNLVVADLFGNRRPEIIAAFGPEEFQAEDSVSPGTLRIAIWNNSCLGDVTADGRTGVADLARVLASFGLCEGESGFDLVSDLDRSGCIDAVDLMIALEDFGCNYAVGGDSINEQILSHE